MTAKFGFATTVRVEIALRHNGDRSRAFELASEYLKRPVDTDIEHWDFWQSRHSSAAPLLNSAGEILRADARSGAGIRVPTCLAGQEIVDQLREFRRLLHLRHVAAILDDGEPRARDGTLIKFAALERRDRVLASPHQQCRRDDAWQQLTQGKAVHIRLPRDAAGHLAVLLDDIGLFCHPLLSPVAHELGGLLGSMEGAPQSGQPPFRK